MWVVVGQVATAADPARTAPRSPRRRSPAAASCRRRPHTIRGRRTRPRSPRGSRRARPGRRAPSWTRRAPSSPAARSASRRRDAAARPASRAASVPQCTNRRTPARRQPASAFSVPVTLPATNSSRVPHWPRWAARWKAAAQPAAPAAIDSGSARSPRTGSAPSRSTACAEAVERASARTRRPSALSRRSSAPPMNPEPPVTNASPAISTHHRQPTQRVADHGTATNPLYRGPSHTTQRGIRTRRA